MSRENIHENELYVISSDFRLQEFNDKVRMNYPAAEVGKLCYKVIRQREEPCLHCPLVDQDGKDSYIFFNTLAKTFSEAVFCQQSEDRYTVISRAAHISAMELFDRLKSEIFHLSGDVLKGAEQVDVGVMSIYLEPERSIYYISSRMLELLGYSSREEFLGEINNSALNLIHPDDYEDVKQDLMNATRPGDKYETSFRMSRRDGSWSWTITRGEVVEVEDGRLVLVGVVADVTNSLSPFTNINVASDELIKRNNYWNAAFENMPGGYYRTEARKGYPFTYVSEHLLQVTGWTREEIFEKFDNKLCNMIADELADKAWRFDPALMIGSGNHESNRILQLKTKNGLRWMNSSLMFVDLGEESFMQGTLSDIHDQISTIDDAERAAEANIAQVAKAEPSEISAYYNDILKGKRVLLIDNSDFGRVKLSNMLQQVGAVCEVTDTGVHGVTMLKKAAAGYYDFVLVNSSLAWISGYDTAGMIREIEVPEKAQIPIIMIISQPQLSETDEQQLKKYHIEGWVGKPVELPELFEAVTSFMK